jgi:hypothetical protein
MNDPRCSYLALRVTLFRVTRSAVATPTFISISKGIKTRWRLSLRFDGLCRMQ